MSAANRKGVVRETLDRYYTPDDLARACVRVIPREFRLIIEPSVGGGAFARACRERVYKPHIIGVDLDPGAAGFSVCDDIHVCDWLDVDPFTVHKSTRDRLVIGNPPYSSAEQHIVHALEVAGRGGMVATVLRLNFLAGKARGVGFWRNNPPSIVHVLSRRPSFTGGGSDATDYGFFIWDRWNQFPRTELTWLEW